MSELELSLALFGGIALTLGLLSRWLRQSFVSENVLALFAGVLIGPLAFGLLDVREWADQETIIEHVALITLAIALMEIGLRLPKREFLRHLRSYAILLGALMPLMWLTTSLLVWLILDLPIWLAILIGAVITPTDPIVASSIVTGPVAERFLPGRIRDTLWAESGANDGLAYPFVILPILVLEQSLSGSLSEWFFRSILWEVGAGALLGIGIGYGAGKLLMWAERQHSIDKEPFMAFTLMLSLTTVGIAALLGTKALLAVFIAGVVFHLSVGEHEDEEVETVQGAIDQFFTIPVFALIGMTIPLQGWLDLGWSGPLLVVAVLFLRRLPAMLLVHRWVGSLQSWSDALFVGWFGPIGIGALYYAAFALGQTGYEEVWVAGTLIICASIVVHGTTASPLCRLYGRINNTVQRQESQAAEMQPTSE